MYEELSLKENIGWLLIVGGAAFILTILLVCGGV